MTDPRYEMDGGGVVLGVGEPDEEKDNGPYVEETTEETTEET